MPTGVTRAPETDSLRIDDLEALDKADRPAPIGNLPPRIDILPRLAVARAEIAMIVQQHNESVLGEQLRKRLDAMVFYGGVAMPHRNGRIPTRCTGRNEQPPTQHHAAIYLEFDFRACHHV